MMRPLLIPLILVLACVTSARAAQPQAEVIADYDRSASNHCAYPIVNDSDAPQLTAAPAGYEAFYINHYGRHGSRWLSNASSYQLPIQVMERAQRSGQLTFMGQRLLRDLRHVGACADNRAGELSDLGAEQHQAIARRMYHNFPGVFAGQAVIDARSTVVIRCILSMQNATMTLRAANPQLRITTDASYHDMHYMGRGYGPDTLSTPVRKSMNAITDSLYQTCINTERFMDMLFTDTVGMNFGRTGLMKLMRGVFNIAGSLQGHHVFDGWSMYHYFTNDEIFELWRLRNIYWYIHWGNAPHNGHRMPFAMRSLLTNMVQSADRAIEQGRRGADLRFGHETCLLPLSCLMELDDVNRSTDDLDNLHLHWQDYATFPKGCNIQMVFYRPLTGTGDILVKVLLNEHEATLPAGHVQGPYYRWSDLRDYYNRKLNTSIDWTP